MLDYPTLRAGEFYRSERKSANIRNINSRDKQAADFCCLRLRKACDMRICGAGRARGRRCGFGGVSVSGMGAVCTEGRNEKASPRGRRRCMFIGRVPRLGTGSAQPFRARRTMCQARCMSVLTGAIFSSRLRPLKPSSSTRKMNSSITTLWGLPSTVIV